MNNLKEKTTENLKAIAYDLTKTLKYYGEVLEAIEKEIELRSEKEVEMKKARKDLPPLASETPILD